MNFISSEFILFFPLVFLLYWLSVDKFRWIILLVSSYIFYLYLIPWTFFLLLSTTLISYIASRAIAGAKSKRLRKFWLILSLVVCLGFLVVFKYLGFLAENITALLGFFGMEHYDLVFSIFLPVGISFYTFQTLSYVLDVYHGDIQPETHFGYFALYISYFPQLVAGPIERPKNLLTQLRKPKQIKATDLMAGFQLMLRGFFKKIVIADYLAPIVDSVYGAPDQARGPSIVFATVMFAFQIYCDFSGYSDIAVGIARMMGIELMKNFNSPYLAVSIQDFWRRWHISLTSWFTDYIYKPLGGNRRGVVRHCINVMIVFLISGIWHGASWNFIIWGGIHGVYLVCGIIWRKYRGVQVEDHPKGIGTITKRFVTFVLVCFAWIFFRANSLGEVTTLLGNMWADWSFHGFNSAIIMMKLNTIDVIRMILMFTCLQLLGKLPTKPISINKQVSSLEEYAGNALLVFELIVLISLGWLALLSINAGSSFIYFQF